MSPDELLALPDATGLRPPLRALWHAARGEWDCAHALAQSSPGQAGAWVHAHLHRIDGDLGNAAYWYARAEQPVFSGPPEAERAAILRALIDAPTG